MDCLGLRAFDDVAAQCAVACLSSDQKARGAYDGEVGFPFSSRARLILALPLAIVGCEGDPGEPAEKVVVVASPIIGGVLDTTDTAVVAVLGSNFACSGTIIQVTGTTGYVLTAGHCCPQGNPPLKVVMGNDYNSGQQFNVIGGSALQDSCYENCPGSTDDVCMLKFSGATQGTTPVIPAMTPQTDQLVIGEMLTYVGYGLTQPPPGQNSKRRSVVKGIGTLDPYFVEYDNPSASGTCEGDSGGPAIASTPSGNQVAAVTSYGDQSCTSLGASIRTSSVYTDFIAPYLAGTTPMPTCPVTTDCNVCSQISTNQQCSGSCSTITQTCLNDANCSALVTCYQSCATVTCQDTCNTQHVAGLQKYEAINACICAGSCSSVCATGFCAAAECGIYPSASPAGCKTCVENDCCAEAWTCSTDANCRACFNKNPPGSCMTNTKAQAYYQCVSSKCPSAGCVIANPANAAGSSTAAATSTASTGGAGGAAASSSSSTGGSKSTGTGGTGGTTSSGCSCEVADTGSDVPLGLCIGVGAMAVFGRRRRAWIRRTRAGRESV